MRITPASRLSLAGMAGLALLSGTHWARESLQHPGASLAYLLGVLPNLAAGQAMPLILASLMPSISGAPPAPDAPRRFLLVLSFTTLGLFTWELIQTRSDRFYFDLHDLGATVVGALVAHTAWRWLRPTRSPS